MYSQGPCNPGEWVVPDRSKGQRKGRGWKMGKCECRPGYTLYEEETSKNIICQPPTVVLARFLNNKTEKSMKLPYTSNSNKQSNESTDVHNTIIRTIENRTQEYR